MTSDQASSSGPPPTPGIAVVYEDDHVWAVAKPEGLAAIPERDVTRPCVQHLLADQVGAQVWVVHRLDKEVSGVMLFARSATAHRWFSTQFAERRVHKQYLALVHGRVATDQGRIEWPLRVCGSGRVAVDPERGRPSVTEYAVIARGADHTLITAEPVTGRQHQIRAHLYGLGHALVGDLRYGDPARSGAAPRLMLHAAVLSCQLPGGGPLTVCVAPSPGFVAAVHQVAGLAVPTTEWH